MAPITRTGSVRPLNRAQEAFTLIELLVVMAIIGTLMAITAPPYFQQQDKARETVLRHNLVTLRRAIDSYREDRGDDPPSLQELVSRRYLREMPFDPITRQRDSWVLLIDPELGIGDVRSGAPGQASDGSNYSSW
ncbi:type II secretion system protein G [Burkholderia ubonensis]|uniref:type II secretion system protein n=1 Tax=Burkholderia ubonensis TaxID=101571 RepID=UPI00075CBF3A|nr:prepilin-type N-terminal cleavage/methylation domain-containing protein [Burkholderia ubonensis]KVU38837.1 type II secretion system protein G [Burkholderia ubonensis]